MSHRVTTDTEIKNREFALSALKKIGTPFKDLGKNKLEVRSGKSTGTLDLATGTITGDTDRWHAPDFDLLKQHYAEEAYVAELHRQGASVQSREVDKEGNIVITFQTTG